MDDKNRTAYLSEEIVDYYSSMNHLYPPELRILGKFEEKLPSMKMLDIGVGGGRTTQFFGQLASAYIGIDYSQKMIDECRKKFGNSLKMKFQQCDARNMGVFPENFFDFIFFSFNGIDYMSHEDRIQTLKEIIRVCKRGGYFCFSTHNLGFIEELFKFKVTLNPKTFLSRIYDFIRIRLENEDLEVLKRKNYAIICDQSHNFKMTTHYIRPIDQIMQLEFIGFKKIQVYSSNNGADVTNYEGINNNSYDQWLYFLCEA